MTRPQPDEDLHAAFQAQRAAERRRTPAYAAVAARPVHRVPWLLLSGALATVVAGFWLTHQASSTRDLEFARRVMAWKSPTASLLPAASLSLIDSIPRFGISVPGSALRALDPGGPLGPPLTRSPRL